MKRILLCVGALSLWGMGAIAENGPLEPHVTSSEHPSGLASLGLEVASYAPGSDPIRFRTPTHLAFGPGSQEIVSDLKNNRFVFRDSPEAPFQVSPITLNGQHSVVYNPADKLYYEKGAANEFKNQANLKRKHPNKNGTYGSAVAQSTLCLNNYEKTKRIIKAA